jgi:hypothetical protein
VNARLRSVGVGGLLAVVGLVVVIVLAVTDHELTSRMAEGLFALAFVARLID